MTTTNMFLNFGGKWDSPPLCFSESDSILFDHLNKPRAKNATYISPRSQNEIINVIGHDIILANIVAEAKQSKFYSVLADEVAATTLSNYLFVFDLWTVKAAFMKNS